MQIQRSMTLVTLATVLVFFLTACGPSRTEVEKNAEIQKQELEKRLNDQLNASDKANRKLAESILQNRIAAIEVRTKAILFSLQQTSDGIGFQDELTTIIDKYTNLIADLPNGNEHQWDSIMSDCKKEILKLFQKYNGKKVTFTGTVAANPDGSEVTLKPISPIGKDLLTGKVVIGPGKWTGMLKEVIGSIFANSKTEKKDDLLSSRMNLLNEAVEGYIKSLRRMTVRSGSNNNIQMVVFSEGLTESDIDANYEKGIKQKSIARNAGAAAWSLAKAVFSTGDEAVEDIKGDWMTNEALKGRITIRMTYKIAQIEDAVKSADISDDSVIIGDINIRKREWEEGTVFKNYHKVYIGEIDESPAVSISDLIGKRVISAKMASKDGIKIVPIGLVPVGK